MGELLSDEDFELYMRRGDEVDLERIARAEREDRKLTEASLVDEREARKAAEAALAEAREVLEWYGEQARLARLIHREGDKGRHALADDGGKRARALLTPKDQP